MSRGPESSSSLDERDRHLERGAAESRKNQRQRLSVCHQPLAKSSGRYPGSPVQQAFRLLVLLLLLAQKRALSAEKLVLLRSHSRDAGLTLHAPGQAKKGATPTLTCFQ